MVEIYKTFKVCNFQCAYKKDIKAAYIKVNSV